MPEWWSSDVRATSRALSLDDLKCAMREVGEEKRRPFAVIMSHEEYEFHRARGEYDFIAWIMHKTGATKEEIFRMLDEIL